MQCGVDVSPERRVKKGTSRFDIEIDRVFDALKS